MPDTKTATYPLVLTAGVFLTIAWLLAQYPPIPQRGSVDDVSLVLIVLVAGALPWFLQWVGVTCAIAVLLCRGMRRGAFHFAMITSLLLATIWWIGIALKLQGQHFLESILELQMFELQSAFGTASFFDECLFHFVGPIVGLVQLRGPMTLSGWDFPLAVLSTALIFGYLLLIGQWSHIGSGAFKGRDCLKLVVGLLLLYLPAFLRLGLEYIQTSPE